MSSRRLIENIQLQGGNSQLNNSNSSVALQSGVVIYLYRSFSVIKLFLWWFMLTIKESLKEAAFSWRKRKSSYISTTPKKNILHNVIKMRVFHPGFFPFSIQMLNESFFVHILALISIKVDKLNSLAQHCSDSLK